MKRDQDITLDIDVRDDLERMTQLQLAEYDVRKIFDRDDDYLWYNAEHKLAMNRLSAHRPIEKSYQTDTLVLQDGKTMTDEELNQYESQIREIIALLMVNKWNQDKGIDRQYELLDQLKQYHVQTMKIRLKKTEPTRYPYKDGHFWPDDYKMPTT